MNITEFAKAAGVSKAAVSRYFNGGALSEEKRALIAAAVEATGYRPSVQAQMLRTRRTRQVGVVLPKLSSESCARMVDGISRVLGEQGYQLLLMNEDDYPKFPEVDANKSLTIPDDKIKELIKKTIFSCSSDDARPLFTGILVEAKDDKLTFVGTNTHRLAVKFLPQPTEEPLNMIIPSKVLNEISRNLTSDMPQEVKISLLNNQIMVVIDDITIVSRLIEGKFPDYNKVIPAKFAVKCQVNAKSLASAVERVALFSTEGDYSTVKMIIGQGEMTLTSSSPDVGTGKEVLPCTTEGDSLNVAFNAKYILDILKNVDAEEVLLSMNTSLSPVCITAPEEDNYIYIVTPVRVVF